MVLCLLVMYTLPLTLTMQDKLTLKCSDFSRNDEDTSTIESYSFCTRFEESHNCSETDIDGESVPADEVLYDADRDSANFIGCRNFRAFDRERVCRMPRSESCNGISNCDTDECNCTVGPNTNTFLCPTGGCITDRFLCNGYGHCPRKEDEYLCFNAHKCDKDDPNSEWVPNFRVCDGYYQCDNWSDEDPALCKEYNLTYSQPRKYITKCTKTGTDTPDYKLKVTKICDGTDDCEDYNDEADCTFTCSDGTTKIPKKFVCDSYPHCPDASDECNLGCNRTYMIPDDYQENNPWYNESIYFPSDPPFCKKYNKSACEDPAKNYQCDNGNCIESLKVCNTLNKCEDWSDETGCVGRFYCKNQNPVWVPYQYVCNGATECLDGSDECQNCNFDILANDESLIANNILSYLVWIMGIVALIGNLILVITKGHELKTMKMNSVTKISLLLLINLAMSDFLMGIYLIGIAAMERTLSGDYCIQSKRWRSSLSCKVLGSICLLSSECSIFMMTLITFHRLISVLLPTKVSTLGRKGLGAWYVAIMLVWLLVLTLAWIPNLHAFQDTFITEAYYENNSFFGSGEKGNLQKYVLRYRNETPAFEKGKEDAAFMTWDEIFEGIEKSGIGGSYREYDVLGFYSSHGVCLHKLFTTTDYKSWMFSLFLNVFNSLCFIFIVVAYSHILTVSKKMTSSKNKGSHRMARKIQRLIFTDACCWIPTCITAYLHIAGVQISTQMYAYTAILILPINSCLNPIVYTDVIDQILKCRLKGHARVQPGPSGPSGG